MRFVRFGVAVMTATALLCAPAYGAPEPVTREVVGVTAPDDALFPASVEASGTVYMLEGIEWRPRVITGRDVAHAVEYDFGPQVRAVDAPATLDAVYHDKLTGANVKCTLALEHVTSGGSASTRGREREVFVHTSYDTASYTLADGVAASFTAARPQTTGDDVTTALLSALHYDPAVYRVVSASWSGPARRVGAKTVREALYLIERRAGVQTGVYSGTVALPDVVTYDGTATYRLPTPTEQVKQTVAEVAEVAAEVADDPFSYLPLVAAGAVAGTSILGAVIFWRRRRRRKNDDETEPDTLEMEADDA